jgi:hypothetical protein
MIYLASPYSSPLPELVQDRYQRAVAFTMSMIAQGVPCFSPIAYCHPFALAAKMPTDAQFWLQFNMQFLRKAEAVFVLRLPGWDQSKGVQIELKMAKALHIPIIHFDQSGQQLNTADDPTQPPAPTPLKGTLKRKQ